MGPFGGDGVEHTGNSVRDIIFNDMPDEERCEIDAHNREYKIQPVDRRNGEPLGEKHLYLLDNPV